MGNPGNGLGTNKNFPFLWGLWTASLTRLKLWRLLKYQGWDRVIYWDTDSCKFEGVEKVPAVDGYNGEIKRQCIARKCVVQKDNGKCVYIGVAEDEHPLQAGIMAIRSFVFSMPSVTPRVTVTAF